MKSNSTNETGERTDPSAKPRKDFPLGVHKGSGYWCKKVRGTVHYFGKVADDPKGQKALETWLRDKDDLLAGRQPRAKVEAGPTLADLCNEFLTHKEHLRDTGELSPRTWATYFETCERLIKEFKKARLVTDIGPNDFAKLRKTLAKTRGAVSLRNEMQRVRSVFKFAFDNGLIQVPVRFGQGFAKPKLEAVRKAREAHKNQHGERLFEAKEIRSILAECKPALRAMVLLAANGGLGQADLGALPVRSVNLETGILDYARVKTAVSRRVPLWLQTTEAIREWLKIRPDAKDKADAGLMFLTVRGARWVKSSEAGSPTDGIAQEFNKIVKKLNLKRSRVGFYALRHGFETIAGETLDQVAVNAIMGHVDSSMAGNYRERIGDDRLQRVVEHVRKWLFPTPATTEPLPTSQPTLS